MIEITTGSGRAALDQILAAMQGVGDYAARPSGLRRLNPPHAI